MPFEFKKLSIPEVILVKPKVFHDNRGFFMESYEKKSFEKVGITGEFIQDNHSMSHGGVIRGLHFQKNPYAQAKLVRCVRGAIYDVAVDLRGDSSNYGKYVSIILSEANKYMVYIPKGFAHGFAALTDRVEVIYKVDNIYSPRSEGGIIWNDPDVDIDWPIDEPILSEKDKEWPKLKEVGKIF